MRLVTECLRNNEDENRIEICLKKAINEKPEKSDFIFGYLSTHPSTEERLKRFKSPEKTP